MFNVKTLDRKNIYTLLLIVIAVSAIISALFIFFPYQPFQSSTEPNFENIKKISAVKKAGLTPIRENALISTDVDKDSAVFPTVYSTPIIITPTITPTPLQLPTLQAPTNIPPTIYNSPESLPVNSAYVQSAELIQAGEVIKSGGTVTRYSGATFIVHIGSSKGNGTFNQAIRLSIKKKVGNTTPEIQFLSINKTGVYSISLNSNIVDPADPEWMHTADTVTFTITSNEVPDLSQTLTYMIKKNYSQQGLLTLIVQVYTLPDRTGNRLPISGAEVNLYAKNSSSAREKKYTSNAGQVPFYNLDPGTYEVSVKKGSVEITGQTVTIPTAYHGNDPQENGLFITFPLQTSDINVPKETIKGELIFMYGDQPEDRSGIAIDLYEINTVKKMLTKIDTVYTDNYGLFKFTNITPEKTYRVTFKPPQNYTLIYPDSVNRARSVGYGVSDTIIYLLKPTL